MTFSPVGSVQEAQADVGFQEGHNNSNPYSEWQYGNRYNPYCNSAVCYWAYLAGFRFWSDCTYGEKGEAYTPTYAIKARNHGVWRDKWWRAHPGCDVEFDWGNNGLIDHVEKVVADDGTTVITIGANTGNGVYYRRRDRQYISNFVALTEAGQTAPAAPPPPPIIPFIPEATMIIQDDHYNPKRPTSPGAGNDSTISISADGLALVCRDDASIENDQTVPDHIKTGPGSVRLFRFPGKPLPKGVRVKAIARRTPDQEDPHENTCVALLTNGDTNRFRLS